MNFWKFKRPTRLPKHAAVVVEGSHCLLAREAQPDHSKAKFAGGEQLTRLPLAGLWPLNLFDAANSQDPNIGWAC